MGQVVLNGATSGATTLAPTDGVTVTINLPATSGTLFTASSGTAGTVPYSTGTGFGYSAVGTSGYLLASGGSSTPTWVATTGSGNVVLATSPTFTTPLLGTPTSGNLSNCTADGTNAVGFLVVPQNAQTGSYTLVLADAGKHIYHASGAGAATYTIPAASSVAYPIGTAITFINLSATSISIAITTDTMYLSSAGTTGTRTLAQYGSATAIKVSGLSSSGIWVISGSGLT